jgi:hypothetical protein
MLTIASSGMVHLAGLLAARTCCPVVTPCFACKECALLPSWPGRVKPSWVLYIDEQQPNYFTRVLPDVRVGAYKHASLDIN